MASIKDVAARAGVSVASVSRVLNQSKPVAEATRRRVLAAAEALDYSIDQRARALRRRKSGTLGLIVSDVANPYFPEVIRAIESVAYHSGHDLFLCNSDEDPERERFYVRAMIAQRIGGIIIVPVTFTSASLALALRNDIPIVCLDRRVEDIALDTVLIDNRAGGALAADALLDRGHRRIAAIVATRTTPGSDRLLGFAQRLAERGIPLADELVRDGEYKQSGGHTAARSLFALEDRPTGLFVANHPMTLGALQAARECALNVPHDLSLVAFDDTSWATFLDPPLTTISQPTDQLGSAAATLLIDRVEDRYHGPARSIVLQPHLIDRASIAPYTG
ncbi:MAG: LacI family DNA-binding transcriptional regulator [Candidatus Velthaea sp.]